MYKYTGMDKNECILVLLIWLENNHNYQWKCDNVFGCLLMMVMWLRKEKNWIYLSLCALLRSLFDATINHGLLELMHSWLVMKK